MFPVISAPSLRRLVHVVPASCVTTTTVGLAPVAGSSMEDAVELPTISKPKVTVFNSVVKNTE